MSILGWLVWHQFNKNVRVTSSGRGNYIIKSIVVDNVSSNSVSVVSGFLQGTILRSSMTS